MGLFPSLLHGFDHGLVEGIKRRVGATRGGLLRHPGGVFKNSSQMENKLLRGRGIQLGEGSFQNQYQARSGMARNFFQTAKASSRSRGTQRGFLLMERRRSCRSSGVSSKSP